MAKHSAEYVPASSDRPLGRDLPERAARDDLPGRLAELPGNHPSAADYGSQRGRGFQTHPDGTRADQLDKSVPATERHEWRQPLARGEVERVGPGVVDERASKLQPRERLLADHLAGEGHAVVAVHDGYGREGRKPDAAVDGVLTEFKCLDPGASDRTVKAALTSAKGQARDVLIDGRDSGLTSDDAGRGVRRFLGAPYADGMNAIRIIGDDYEVEWKRG
jgi:Contact-dependent growth inhibition CdiA C-terminal domain